MVGAASPPDDAGGASSARADGGEQHVQHRAALTACPGAVNSVRYSFPLHHNWGMLDLSYQDSPLGLPGVYPNGGVMYDYHRLPGGGMVVDNIPTEPGWRDFMGGDTSYDVHNGYDTVAAPRRLHGEGVLDVHPIAAGTVTWLQKNNSQPSEDIVVVRHANGYHSRYVHLRRGSIRVRVNDAVTVDTVLGTNGTEQAHLHFDFHDCDYNGIGEPPEPSYFEIYRADLRLWGRAPLYDSGPSEVAEVQVAHSPLASDPAGDALDSTRFVPGDALHFQVWAQVRTNDTVTSEIIDSNGSVRGSFTDTHTNTGRWIHVAYPHSFTLPGSPSGGQWHVRVSVNGQVRARKWFYVATGATPNANGPVQSTPSVVASGRGNLAVYYADGAGYLKSRRWTLEGGWGPETNHSVALQGSPSCVSRGEGLIDCFYTGTNDHLWRWTSSNHGFTGTYAEVYTANDVLASPSAFRHGAAGLEVIFRHAAGGLGRLSWDGSAFNYAAAGSYPAASGAPSCVALSATDWRCYARNGGIASDLREVRFTSGVQTASTVLTGEYNEVDVAHSNDVTATVGPADAPFATRTFVVGRGASGNMYVQSRLGYADGTRRWLPLNGVGMYGLTVTPACAPRPGTALLECFSADADHELVRNTYTGTRWTGWNPVAISPIERLAPTATTLGNDRIDLFYTSQPLGNIYNGNGTVQRTAAGNRWGTATTLGGANRYGPGCTARGTSNIDCFSVDGGRDLVRTTWNGTSWTATASPPPVDAYSQPSAVSLSATNLMVFYRSQTGTLRYQTWNGFAWLAGDVDLGAPAAGPIVDAPGCVARPMLNRVDCYARDAANNLAVISRDAGVWGAWSTVAGARVFSAPSAVSPYGAGAEVYYRGPDDALRRVVWDIFEGFGAEENLGGSLASAPACVVRVGPVRVDCFAQGYGSAPQDLLHYSYQASLGWTLPRALGMGLANLALNQAATQSSEHGSYGAVAARAVDGDLDGRFAQGSVTHTSNDAGPTYAWWQVDLGASRYVDHVQVFNRTDPCCTARINGFLVETRNSTAEPWSPVSTIVQQYRDGMLVNTFNRTNPAYPGVAIPLKRNARYVRVRLNHQDYLSLAEVMVMGREQ